MKKNIFAGKISRSKLFLILTPLIILAIIAANTLITYFTTKNTAYLDLTPEQLYTASEKMIEQCAFIDELPEGKEITITFCADPDTLTDSYVTRATYLMAKKLEQAFSKFTVKTVNVAVNPTAVSQFKTTSMSKIGSSNIILSSGDRYRIVNAQSFWTVNSSDEYWSYNGEYKLASALLSLTNRVKPVAYFVTGHGETVYDPENPTSEGSLKMAAFADLLRDRGLEIKTIDLTKKDVPGVPEDCSLLIINAPTSDFTCDETQLNSLAYQSETEKIDRYLTAGNGSLIVALNYDLTDYDGYAEALAAGKSESFEPLYNLKTFLRGWGFRFSSYQLKDPGNSLDEDGESIIGVYVTDEDSYGNAIYGDFASSSSAPKMIFTDTGYIECAFGLDTVVTEQGGSYTTRIYDEFIYSSSTSLGKAYDEEKGEYLLTATEPGKKALASVVARQYLDAFDAVSTYSYVFCTNSDSFFSNELIGNSSYANYDVVSALVENMVRNDVYASNELGGSSFNSPTIGGKQLVSEKLSSTDSDIYSADAQVIIGKNLGIKTDDIVLYSIIIFAIPAIIGVCGIAVCLRRRFL